MFVICTDGFHHQFLTDHVRAPRNIRLFKSTNRNRSGIKKILFQMYPNERFYKHTHTEDPDDHLAVSFLYYCCCWRNPLAILVIINYSKWINLTRHRTTKVILNLSQKYTCPSNWLSKMCIKQPMMVCIEIIRYKHSRKCCFFFSAVNDSDEDDDDDSDDEKWSLCACVPSLD